MGTNSNDTVFTVSIETRDPDLARRVALAVAGVNSSTAEHDEIRDLQHDRDRWRRRAEETADAHTCEKERADSLRDSLAECGKRRGEMQDAIDAFSETESERRLAEVSAELRVYEGERARMAIEKLTMVRELESARKRLAIMSALCGAAQQWEGPNRTRPDHLRGHSDIALASACEEYETAMAANVLEEERAEAAITDDDIPF